MFLRCHIWSAKTWNKGTEEISNNNLGNESAILVVGCDRDQFVQPWYK